MNTTLDGITGDTIQGVRIVLHTACLVTAVRSGSGAAGEIVRMVLQRRLVLLMDLKIALEYRDVALRPQHLMASALNEDEVLELIEALEAFAMPIEVFVRTRPPSPDPNDDMVLDLAMSGGADALVTYNTKHFLSAGKRFGIAVVTPAELLTMLSEGEQHGH